MEKIILDDGIVRRVLADALLKQDAEIFRGSTQQPFEVQVVNLDLTTARTPENPYPIRFPFKSVFVRTATDSSVSLDLRVQTQDSYQGKASLKLNDSLIFGQQQASAFLSWDAQSGKTMSLIFFVSAEFRSGSQVSQNAGGVSISDGTSATDSCVSTTASTVVTCFSANTSRKKGTIQNATGGSIFVGPLNTVSNTGANRGFEVVPGAVFYWRNTAALYAYPAANSTNGLFLREES